MAIHVSSRRIQEMKPAKCLNPECGEVARVRGLCRDCYSAALYQVAGGRTSWKALEKVGKALPGKQKRRANWVLGQ